MNWKLLGIEETKDKKAIKQAYRNKLSEVNPEDKPEEFMALRAAYEEALQLSDAANTDEAPKTEVDLWRDKLQALYDDFQKRIDVRYWEQLLSEDVCVALDTRPQIEETLLRFFMETYRIPQSVWKYLDERFSFSTRVGELYENYPRDFVDYVIVNGINYPEYPELRLFSPGKDGEEVERFIDLFRQMRGMPIDEARKHIDELLSLPEQHPYAQSYVLLVAIGEGDKAKIEDLRSLAAKYPDNDTITYDLASTLYEEEDYKGAEQQARIIYDRSRTYGSGVLIARSLAGQKLYKEACDQVEEIADDYRGNQDKQFELVEMTKAWNAALVDKYRAELEKDPDNYDTRYELFTCLNFLERTDEARAEMEKFPDGKPDEYAYCNMHSRIYFNDRRYEEALGFVERQIAAAKKLVPDGTRRTTGRIEYADTLNYIRGLCYLNMEKEEEANRIFEECLEKRPDDPQMLINLSGLRLGRHQYALAAQTAERLAELQPDSAYAHGLLASCLYGLFRDRDALDAIDRSIALNSSDLYSYLLKMKLFARNNVEQGVEDVAALLEGSNITDLPVVAWCRAQIKAKKEDEGMEAEALKDYETIAERIKDEEKDISWMPEFYYMYSRLVANVTDKTNKTDDDAAAARKRIVEILDKGLDVDPDDPDCMDYKAWLLKKSGKRDESIELYRKLEKDPGRRSGCAEYLAELYYDDLSKDADKAYEYYSYLLSRDEDNSSLHFYVGMCLFYMGRLEEAAEIFARESELDVDDVDGYYRLSMVRAAQGRLEEALEQADKAVDVVRSWQRNRAKFFKYKAMLLRRMGRYEEAAETVMDARATIGDYNPYPLLVDIHEQKGDFVLAKDCLKRWRKEYKRDMKVHEQWVICDYLAGNDRSAHAHYMNWISQLQDPEKENVNLLRFRMDAAKGVITGPKALIRVYEKIAKDLDPEKDLERYCMKMNHYIDSLYMHGSPELAKEKAQDLLKVVEEHTHDYSINGLLWETRWAAALGMAGQIDKAREVLENIKTRPLCSFCSYESCKDADLINVEIEVYEGNIQKALELTNTYLEKWHDDTAFIEYKKYLERKVKK